jgi:SNF2 family DNA or RNA helicase
VVPAAPSNVVEYFSDNARLELLESLLDELLQEADNKVIIWSNYTAELDSIEKVLEENKYNYVRVEGGCSSHEQNHAKDTFNKDKNCRVYLGQVSTGIGITLNSANYMIYYNLPWSLEHYLQSLDRNYRIGQKRKVTVYRLLALHTLDESKAAALDKKMDFSHLVTTRSICATCPEFTKRCASAGIQLYDPLCIYDRKMLRETAKVRLIP